jgi:hypothetical protein
MSQYRDRIPAIRGSLRKSFSLPDRSSDRQFQDLLHRLSRIPDRPEEKR